MQLESDRKLVSTPLGNEMQQDHPCDKEEVINSKTLGSQKGNPTASIDTCALSSDNLLHAGTTLKNTEYVYGVCVYGGAETKVRKGNSVMLSIVHHSTWSIPNVSYLRSMLLFQMALNSRITNNKFGSIEKMLNRYLIFFVVVLVMEMVVSTILTMEKGVEYIDTDQSFNESTTIERLRFLGNITHSNHN